MRDKQKVMAELNCKGLYVSGLVYFWQSKESIVREFTKNLPWIKTDCDFLSQCVVVKHLGRN